MNSPLAKLQPTYMNDEQLHDVKLRAWREHGILVVRVDEDALNWTEREQVNQLGGKLYGKRT